MYYLLLYKIWKLQRERERTRKYHHKRINAAEKKRMPQEEIDSLMTDAIFEDVEVEDKIIQMQTWCLSRQAEKYFIPTPRLDEEDAWERCTHTRQRRWNPQTILKMKATIREEQKYRREYWQSWVTLSIGVIGALTGLAFGLVALVK